MYLKKMKILTFPKKSAAHFFEIGWKDFFGIFTYVSWDPYLPYPVRNFF